MRFPGITPQRVTLDLPPDRLTGVLPLVIQPLRRHRIHAGVSFALLTSAARNPEEGTMARVMQMHWREATPGQYDQAREKVGWDRDVPDGARLHVSGFGDDGLHVTDVWESEQAFNAFMEHRLAPVIQ